MMAAGNHGARDDAFKFRALTLRQLKDARFFFHMARSRA